MNGSTQIIITLTVIAGVIGISLYLMTGGMLETKPLRLGYHAAPADNPLKGFFPFRGDYDDTFPHSMEWEYFPLSALMNGPDSFTFEEHFEPALTEITDRGHHMVMRVYLDYPEKPSGVPKFLIDEGLKMTAYEEHGGGQSPDYSDEKLIRALESFIAEFGRRYDGDPRIGFITIGLLGFWGEWHTFPNENWFPSEDIQIRILDAYHKAFNKTKLLLRRPAANAPSLPIGYHDDSFAFSTLPSVDWHFVSMLQKARLTQRWETQPIGGELRPELQSNIWRRPIPADPPAEDFDECVQQTHCSWLINQALFTQRLPATDYERALQAAQSLGYEIHVSEAAIPPVRSGNSTTIELKVENRGNAPFYYDWEVQIRIQKESTTLWKLSKLLPGQAVEWKHEMKIDLHAGEYPVSIRVVNPLQNGKPFYFANQEQQPGAWLMLGNLTVR